MGTDTVRLNEQRDLAPSLPDERLVPFQCDQFLARCLGNAEFAWRILQKFQRIFEDDLEGMQQALRLSDAEAVARVAHRLKGSAGNVAAMRLRHVLANLEQSGRHGRLDEVPRQLELLVDEWWQFLQCAGLTSGHSE